MLQGDYTIWNLGYIIVKALASIGLWGIASVGYMNRAVTWPERIIAALGALFLVAALPMTDQIGFALGVVFLIMYLQPFRRPKSVSPTS
jgi:TRAP-type uncharacterized transport system fused permease subunit